MLRSFTKLVGTAVIVLGLASAAHAQTEADIIRPLTKAGSAAFMFTFGGFGTFNLGAPVIGTVSSGTTNQTVSGAGMKYFFSDDLALRLAFAFGTNSSGADTLTGGKETNTNYGIGAAVEYHMRPLYSTSPYIGGGINFASASRTMTNKVGTADQDTKISGTTFGVGIFAGFDWFFTRGIALGAEYGLGFATTSSSLTTPNGTSSTTTDAPSSSSIGLGLNGAASVHAVVYF